MASEHDNKWSTSEIEGLLRNILPHIPRPDCPTEGKYADYFSQSIGNKDEGKQIEYHLESCNYCKMDYLPILKNIQKKATETREFTPTDESYKKFLEKLNQHRAEN